MGIEEMGKQLKLLQDELACLRAAEQHVQDKITTLLKELDHELKQPNEQKHINDLSTLLRRFEAEHPELTDSINRVMMTLSNMGI